MEHVLICLFGHDVVERRRDHPWKEMYKTVDVHMRMRLTVRHADKFITMDAGTEQSTGIHNRPPKNRLRRGLQRGKLGFWGRRAPIQEVAARVGEHMPCWEEMVAYRRRIDETSPPAPPTTGKKGTSCLSRVARATPDWWSQ